MGKGNIIFNDNTREWKFSRRYISIKYIFFFNKKMWNENRVESISFVVVNRFRIELEQSRSTAFLYVLCVGMYI